MVRAHNTLADFSDAFQICASCARCGRLEPIDRTNLPPEMTIDDLRARVRCEGCGRRTGEIRIVYVGKTGFNYRRH